MKKSKLLVAVLFWSSWTRNCKNSKTMKIPSFLDIYRFALLRWQSFRHCCILLRVQVFVVKKWVFLQPLNHYSVFVRVQIGLDLDFFLFFSCPGMADNGNIRTIWITDTGWNMWLLEHLISWRTFIWLLCGWLGWLATSLTLVFGRHDLIWIAEN